MDRRLHERTRVQYEARVTTPLEKKSTIGRVCDISGAGISVVLAFQPEPGNEIRMEMADSVLLGRVVYANPEGSQFRVGVEVGEVRLGHSEIAGLLERTLVAVMPALPGLEHSETQHC